MTAVPELAVSEVLRALTRVDWRLVILVVIVKCVPPNPPLALPLEPRVWTQKGRMDGSSQVADALR